MGYDMYHVAVWPRLNDKALTFYHSMFCYLSASPGGMIPVRWGTDITMNTLCTATSGLMKGVVCPELPCNVPTSKQHSWDAGPQARDRHITAFVKKSAQPRALEELTLSVTCTRPQYMCHKRVPLIVMTPQLPANIKTTHFGFAQVWHQKPARRTLQIVNA